MAKIGLERWGLFKKQILEILSEHPEGLNVNELFPVLERRMPPTDFENGVYESDGVTRRWPYVVRFSTIHAVKAGWLVKDQGHWAITEAGKQIVKQNLQPIELERKARDLYRKWDLNRPADDDEEQSEEIELVASIEKLNLTLSLLSKNSLLKYLLTDCRISSQHYLKEWATLFLGLHHQEKMEELILLPFKIR